MQTASVLYRPQYTPSQKRNAVAFLAARARLTQIPTKPTPPIATVDYDPFLGIETMELWALTLSETRGEEYEPWFWMVPLCVPVNIQPKIKMIQRVVATHYGVTVADIVSARRTADVVMPRHVAMFVAKRMTGRSLPEIGRRFGMRDHTSVLSAVRKIRRLCSAQPHLAASIVEIESTVLGVSS